jgi:predicted Zn-ribbon and HTH transcriptional regulator
MQTIRRQIMELLSRSECSARVISQSLRISEKEVYDHLAHIARSVTSQKKRLVVTPSQCEDCGYTFADRRRFTKPGRCPRCKGEHLSEPKYRID